MLENCWNFKVFRSLYILFLTPLLKHVGNLSVGLSRQYVGDVLARRRPPGPRLLSALGLVRETRIVARRS